MYSRCPDNLTSFTVGCKTDDGFTVILVERSDGVETKSIKTSYSTSAGTAYITVRRSQRYCKHLA